MGDSSDDEYDRKRLDTFRGEPNERYSSESSSEDWSEGEGSWDGVCVVARPSRGLYIEYTRARDRDDRRYGSDYPPYCSAWCYDFALISLTFIFVFILFFSVELFIWLRSVN